MNAPLRKAGVVVILLFAMLFINLNWVQVYKADDYTSNEELNHVRMQAQEYERARGKIVVNGVSVAESKETTGTLKYKREYPFGTLYAHVVGYKPVDLGSTGIEKMEN